MDNDVVRMLDHAGIRRANLVGYSMGGGLVGRLLIRQPARFITATLVGASGLASAAGDAQRDAMATEFERGDARSLVMAVWPTNEAKPTESQIREASAKVFGGNDRLALAALLRAPVVPVSQQDLALASAKIPLLGVAGTADPALSALTAMKKNVPQLKVIGIEGSGHTASLGRPELIDAIEQFLAAHNQK
jgi:pimeloyl-ACP methyl ester carboxylesterase